MLTLAGRHYLGPGVKLEPGSISEEIDHRIKGRGARCIWIQGQATFDGITADASVSVKGSQLGQEIMIKTHCVGRDPYTNTTGFGHIGS